MAAPDFNVLTWSEMEEEVRLANERQRAAGLPPEKRYRSLHADSALFLYQLVLATRARTVVEVGMSAGYSALWLARACAATGGRVITLERDAAIVNVARAHFARAGVERIVDIRVGDAREILPTLETGLDVLFLDGEKDEYPAYAEGGWPKLRVGGSVVADNVISHRDRITPYLEGMLARDDATTIVLPIGQGLAWTVKTA